MPTNCPPLVAALPTTPSTKDSCRVVHDGHRSLLLLPVWPSSLPNQFLTVPPRVGCLPWVNAQHCIPLKKGNTTCTATHRWCPSPAFRFFMSSSEPGPMTASPEGNTERQPGMRRSLCSMHKETTTPAQTCTQHSIILNTCTTNGGDW